MTDTYTEPVAVHIKKDDTIRTPVYKGCYGIYRTFQSASLPECILPASDKRKSARVNVMAAMASTETEILPANPAAGAPINYVNTSPNVQVIQSVAFTLTTSAVVGNRRPGIEILDAAGNIVMAVQNSSAVVASTVDSLFLTAGVGTLPNAATGFTTGALPLVTLQPGWTLRLISLAFFDAGDQISNAVITLAPINGRVFLCGSNSDAQSSGGLGPQGMMLEAGMYDITIDGQNDVWLVCPDANAPLVSVSSVYDK